MLEDNPENNLQNCEYSLFVIFVPKAWEKIPKQLELSIKTGI